METIFATATAPIKSGVAIIRISGDDAYACYKAMTDDKPIKPRQAALRRLNNPISGEMIDEAVVLWFPAPASFTGENTIELHTHGSRAVIDEVMEVLSGLDNYRLAEPGEFSKRAFDNGKMDLTEAEGLADLIDAETKIQARQAMMQKQGALKDLYDKWRKQLISVLANIEAYIDFPDEDIPESASAEAIESVEDMKEDITNHLDDNRRGEKLRLGLQVVIAGAPNVGKSSLLNMLAQRDVAIVSDIAGTTRDIIEVHLNLNGYPVILADTAGLREDAEIIEKEGIKRAKARLESADVRVLMFDAANIDNEDFSIINDDVLVVINKIDKADGITLPDKIARYNPLLISVNEKKGVDALITKLEELAKQHMEIGSDPVITRDRHRFFLKNTIKALEQFDMRLPPELAAENLRQAATCLGRITGHIDVEDILDDIFSNFCIGK